MPLSRPAGLLICEKTCHSPNKSQKNPNYTPLLRYALLLIHYENLQYYLVLHDYLAGKVVMFIKDLVKLCIHCN